MHLPALPDASYGPVTGSYAPVFMNFRKLLIKRALWPVSKYGVSLITVAGYVMQQTNISTLTCSQNDSTVNESVKLTFFTSYLLKFVQICFFSKYTIKLGKK